MAQSNPDLIDFSRAEEIGSRFSYFIPAPSIIEAHPEYDLSLDDLYEDVCYGHGESFLIFALKDAGVLVFWKHSEEEGIPRSLILPITEWNLEAAHMIEYDEFDNPIFDGFLDRFEYFD